MIQITADIELANALKNAISSDTGAIPVYYAGSRPNNNYPEDFVDISIYSTNSITQNLGFVSGNIEIAVYTKLQPDGSIKRNRINKIIEQVNTIVKKLTTQNYFYKINSYNYSTPIIADSQAGYSVTSIYVEWRNTNTN